MIINSFEIDRINEIVRFAKNFSNNVQTIIIGERHGEKHISDLSLQKEIIKIFKPEVVLYEKLKTLWWSSETYEIKLKDGEQDNGYYVDLDGDKICEWIKESKMKIPLIGCDLSPNKVVAELYELRSFIRSLGKTQISKEFIGEFEDIYIKYIREKKMGECINSSKNFKRIIVILGNDHVMNTSYIYNYVKYGYISIYMDDICYNCGRKIEEDAKEYSRCQNCDSIRKRHIEIEKN